MQSFIQIAHHDDLVNPRSSILLSNGKKIVLFRLPTISTDRTKKNEYLQWTYYAMEAECPHAGGPMSESKIDIEDSSYIASCPWHAYDFNLDTGESKFGIKACLFPIHVTDDGNILLCLDSENITMTSYTPITEKIKFKHEPRHDVEIINQDTTLTEYCAAILQTSDPEKKIEMTTQLFTTFVKQSSTDFPMIIGDIRAPEEPQRSSDQVRMAPDKMTNTGKAGTLKSRIAMLHALANIEQWAIDLAIDICIRFSSFETNSKPPVTLPQTFYHDWLKVANDEAKHFSLLRSRLEELGSYFGALPVHHGLWDSARMTAHDLRARISIIALVHEARGLDVNPRTIDKFRGAQDHETVEILKVIHNDEITHVTTGHRWLSWICEQEGTDPIQVFRDNVQKYFRGAVKGPFNIEARRSAGMVESYYKNLNTPNQPSKMHVIAGG